MEGKTESFKPELEKETLDNLAVAKKWSMFLARLGIVFLVLLIIIGIAAGTFLSVFRSGSERLGIPGILLIVVVLALSIFYILPVLYLYSFSKSIDRAIRLNNKAELHKAFKYLKLYFIYLGVLVIVIISLYIIIVGVGGALMAFLKIL